MSAVQAHELQKACNVIVARIVARKEASLPCFLCGIYVYSGEEKLMEHLAKSHAAHVFHFSNVTDYDGFLGCIKLRMGLAAAPDAVAAKDTPLSCPVCLVAVSSAAQLQTHLTATPAHAEWTPATIPELAEFCLPANAATAAVGQGDDAEEEEDCPVGRNDVDPEGAEEELLGSDDDWIDACVCLYCPEECEECLEHMTAAHGFDMRQATRSRPEIADEYDVIRLINAVRRAVREGRCPFNAYSAGETPCAFDGTLEGHLAAHPEHRLPKAVTRESDADLIPVLPADALISLVVTAGEGFLASEQADPDFPMAPTLQEVAAHGSAAEKKQAARPKKASR